MRLLVCGGRGYADRRTLFDTLDALHGQMPVAVLIHGAARGADALAGEWAALRGVPVSAYPADWKSFGRAAGSIRNQTMLDDGRPEMVVAFPGGRGTADMVRRARKAGYPVTEIGMVPA